MTNSKTCIREKSLKTTRHVSVLQIKVSANSITILLPAVCHFVFSGVVLITIVNALSSYIMNAYRKAS